MYYPKNGVSLPRRYQLLCTLRLHSLFPYAFSELRSFFKEIFFGFVNQFLLNEKALQFRKRMWPAGHICGNSQLYISITFCTACSGNLCLFWEEMFERWISPFFPYLFFAARDSKSSMRRARGCKIRLNIHNKRVLQLKRRRELVNIEETMIVLMLLLLLMLKLLLLFLKIY